MKKIIDQDARTPETPEAIQHFPWCDQAVCITSFGYVSHFGRQPVLHGQLMDARVDVRANTDPTGTAIDEPIIHVWTQDKDLQGGPALVRLSLDDARELASALLRATESARSDARPTEGLSDAVRTILGAHPAYDPQAGIADGGVAR